MGLSVNCRGVLTPGTGFSTLSEVKLGLGLGGKMSFTKTHAVLLLFPSVLSTVASPHLPWILSAETPCAVVCFEENPCCILSIHYPSNLNAARKYLELVGAHFKNMKEIQRWMCQRPSPTRGRIPWREYLNKIVHEISRIEPLGTVVLGCLWEPGPNCDTQLSSSNDKALGVFE